MSAKTFSRLFASAIANLGGLVCAAPLTVSNGNFNNAVWNSGGTTKNPAGWTQNLTTAGNYGQTATATPNLTSIAAHLQDRNNNRYIKNLSTDNPGLNLSTYGSYTVTFNYGHRNDSATTTVGTYYLEVSLWDLTNNLQVGATQTVNIASTGQVAIAANRNQLSSGSVTFNYNKALYTGESVGVRFTHAGTSAGADGSQTFNATILLDNISVDATNSVTNVDPEILLPVPVAVLATGVMDFAVPFSNIGISNDLIVSSATVGGTNAAAFSVTGFTSPVAPAANGVVNLHFTPSAAGSYTATLTVNSNDAANPSASVTLSASVTDGDTDSDGLPNLWELANGLDPNDNGSTNPDNGANGNPDSDGLPNSEELFLGSNPQVNESGKAWLPRPAKVGLMVVSTHPDDEGIFFGGAIPYYAQTRGIPTLLVSMTSGDWTLSPPIREAEQRNAAWAYGLRYQPLFPRFRDVSEAVATTYPNKIDATWDYWADGILQNDGSDIEIGKTKAIRYLAEQFRRYRPEVVATHDLDGEYGHSNHKATAWAVTQAYAMAADPAANAPNLTGLPPWQVKKLYVHEYSNRPLFHDHWETASINDGGVMKSPRAIANLGLDFHVTQSRPNVSTVFLTGEVSASWATHPSEWWGLHSSSVGDDAVQPAFTVAGDTTGTTYTAWARGNFLQNLAVVTDLDGNGLADAWEQAHFGGPPSTGAAGDADGDGISNENEFIFGTAPLHSDGNLLTVSAVGTVTGQPPAAVGPGYEGLRRRFALEESDNLTTWLPVLSGVADGSVINRPAAPGVERRFSRLKVWLENTP